MSSAKVRRFKTEHLSPIKSKIRLFWQKSFKNFLELEAQLPDPILFLLPILVMRLENTLQKLHRRQRIKMPFKKSASPLTLNLFEMPYAIFGGYA